MTIDWLRDTITGVPFYPITHQDAVLDSSGNTLTSILGNKLNKITASTDNAVVRFDGTNGAMQNSGVVVNDEREVHASKFVTSGASSTQFVKGDGSLDSNVYSTTAHTHGNITAAGALQTTDVGIANGDKLVVTDASNSNKVARTSVSFDGSTATKALMQKGSFESVVTSFNGQSGSVTVTIPAAQVNSDWNATSGVAQILNKPTIPDVSGKEDTSNKVTSLSSSSTDTQYPSAKCVYDVCSFISGSVRTTYSSLSGLPKLNTNNTVSQTASSNEEINGTINLHKISKTGSYNDLVGKPTLPSYCANVPLALELNYVTEPEFKNVKINGGETNVQSTKNCQLQYDTVNNCLKFVFN